jgi:D-alanyl-D-alanine carboxypeptidase
MFYLTRRTFGAGIIASMWIGRASASSSITRSELVLNAITGDILHTYNASSLIHPASLVKLMTLEILFTLLEEKKIQIDTPVIFSPRAAKQPSTHLGKSPGYSMTIHDAILAMAVHSCNDVATAVAEKIAGEEYEFVKLMNERAKSIGLSSTIFVNACGLPGRPPNDNISTAKDIMLLGANIIARHTSYWPLLGTTKWEHDGHIYTNTNALLGRYPGMDCCKTGYIHESGFNLFASAIRQEKRLLIVVTGEPTSISRDKRVQFLLDSSFSTII